MKDRMIIVLVAIICVTALALIWTLEGHNHSTFSVSIGMIGTMSGYAFGSAKGCSS